MWVALLRDSTFLLHSSSTKGTGHFVPTSPEEVSYLQLTPMQCPIVAAQTLPFWSQTPESACNRAEPLLNFVPSAVIQGLGSLDDAIGPHPPASARPHPGSAALSLPGG